MPAILPFLIKTRAGIALMVALVLMPVIVTQWLTIRSYASDLNVKTGAAAACQVSKVVAEAETSKLADTLKRLNDELKQAQAATEIKSMRIAADVAKEIKAAEGRAQLELTEIKEAEGMTLWYDSVLR